MNIINRLIALLFLVSFVGIALGAAHMWRYAPLNTTLEIQAAPVWDRWHHRQCVISFGSSNSVRCTVDEIDK